MKIEALSTVIPSRLRFQDAADLLGRLRQDYREQKGVNGDVILIAVPPGSGHNIQEQLADAFNNDLEEVPRYGSTQ